MCVKFTIKKYKYCNIEFIKTHKYLILTFQKLEICNSDFWSDTQYHSKEKKGNKIDSIAVFICTMTAMRFIMHPTRNCTREGDKKSNIYNESRLSAFLNVDNVSTTSQVKTINI